MNGRIAFLAKGREYSIPNSWESLTPELYMGLVRDLIRFAGGSLSVAEVRIGHVCRSMGWNPSKVRSEDGWQNIVILSEQVTFPFLIEYPDGDAALDPLTPEQYRRCKRTDPSRLEGVPIAHYLRRLDYRYVIDTCFCAQLLPSIGSCHPSIGSLQGYKVNNSFGRLTCSLTALQFIEARELLDRCDAYPLLTAILYYPGRYSSEGAHELAAALGAVPDEVHWAVSFNFRALVNFLFTRTEFKLLTEPKGTSQSAISTGALEALYNLSSDGLGTADQIEHLGLIQYLTILRKKLIESVRALHASKMDLADIGNETGLSVQTIKEMI